MADTFLQVRTNEADKIAASRSLEELGTNTVVIQGSKMLSGYYY